MSGVLVGYRRSSTDEQIAGYEDQLVELQKAGCTKIFGEMVSSVAERQELERCLDYVREGDTLVAHSLSRLARSLPHLMEIVKVLEAKKVNLRLIKEAIDTNTPQGRLMLGVFGSVFQFERELMLERQTAGIARARAQKKYRGRKPVAAPAASQVQALKAQGFGASQIARKLGMSRSSVYRALETPAQA